MKLHLLCMGIVLLILIERSSSSHHMSKRNRLFPNDLTMRFRLEVMKFDKPMIIPENFDARERWPNCSSLQHVLESDECDACWAVMTAWVLSDRDCIANQGKRNISYSVEDLLTCCENCTVDKTTHPCDSGGIVYEAIKFWIQTGVVSGGELDSEEGCKPYSQNISQKLTRGSCTPKCTNINYNISYSDDKHFGNDARMWIVSRPLIDLQMEIMTRGPLIGLIDITEDFEENGGIGVYKDPGGFEIVGTHVVKIIGWGVENNVSYWLGASIWGKDWGEHGGFFKVERGQNTLKLEQEFIAPDAMFLPALRFASANTSPDSKNLIIFTCLVLKFFYFLT